MENDFSHIKKYVTRTKRKCIDKNIKRTIFSLAHKWIKTGILQLEFSAELFIWNITTSLKTIIFIEQISKINWDWTVLQGIGTYIIMTKIQMLCLMVKQPYKGEHIVYKNECYVCSLHIERLRVRSLNRTHLLRRACYIGSLATQAIDNNAREFEQYKDLF